MLDVRRLRVLREVASRGSFSAAADALHFTQSAVSQQIAALEREAGTTLVERNARGVRLTEAGEVLVRHTDVILARLADAEAELEALSGLRGGRLRLAAFPSAGSSIAPTAIARFRERHPSVDLTMVPAEPPEGQEKLRAGEVDIALLIEVPWGECFVDSTLERQHLLDDPMYVCVPREHKRAGKAKLRMEDLSGESWLLGTGGACPDASIFLRACERAGFEPKIAFRSDDYAAIQGFVAAGLGVALIPELAMTNLREDVVVRSLAPRAPVRRIVAATLAGGYRSAAAAAMLDILIEVGQEYAGGRKLAVVA
ncbi:MAG: LysR family transcriptional regulator [Solirubrobacteraceae bacterium]